jgi:hypothetical protein
MPVPATVDGAILLCNAGSAPSRLTATLSPTMQVNNLAVATIFDNLPGVNIKPFGVCKILGGPCIPVTPVPWQPGEVSIVPSRVPILSSNSILGCAVGGMIQIIDPGQVVLLVDSQPYGAGGAFPSGDGFLDPFYNPAFAAGWSLGFNGLQGSFEMAGRYGGLRAFSWLGKGFGVLSYLPNGVTFVNDVTKGRGEDAAADAVGTGVNVALTTGCVGSTVPEEGASVVGAPLIPFTVAGCGLVGSVAGSLTTKVAKPVIHGGVKVATDAYHGAVEVLTRGPKSVWDRAWHPFR